MTRITFQLKDSIMNDVIEEAVEKDKTVEDLLIVLLSNGIGCDYSAIKQIEFTKE